MPAQVILRPASPSETNGRGQQSQVLCMISSSRPSAVIPPANAAMYDADGKLWNASACPAMIPENRSGSNQDHEQRRSDDGRIKICNERSRSAGIITSESQSTALIGWQLFYFRCIMEHMRLRWLVILVLLSMASYADVIFDVRSALDHKDFNSAQSALKTYYAKNGATPEYIEAMSWVARGSLATKQLNNAESYARQTERLSREQLYKRKLDAEPHLPIALGAALEVQAQVLAARGQQSQAALLLKHAIATYGTTSIRARLQKNLNLLGLAGQPAPPLNINQYLGVRPSALAQLKGSPVFLFFWAHWCGDCKAEGPILTRLRSEYAPRGLTVIAPTQLYGYTAGGEDATPQSELSYVGQVWQKYYSGLQDVPVPVSKANFNTYGASTTPTLVLIDRTGHVAMYHPGAMSYDDLRAAIEKVIGS